MMKPSKNVFAVVLCMIIALVGIAILGVGDMVKGARDMRFGIDIRGGVEAVFEPQGLERKATESELESARNIIETRLDAKNITDREVTIDKEGGYIIVKFPWKSGETNFNPEDAIAELGEMAQLTFRDEAGNIMLEGKNIKSAKAMENTSGITAGMARGYEVSLIFDEKGTKLFEEATEKLMGRRMGIYMDEILISNPTVENKISGGQAVINNIGSLEEASNLAEKINAGALPFSLATTNFSTISPTLGSNALNIMVIAGLIAFGVVCLFMILYYKLPGVIACLALSLQLALQLLSISMPQYTLTLPGIAGIILSVGMSVDANIIIAERIGEELRKGLSIRVAIKNGYKSAFSSVLDGNVTTAIVAVILMILGSGTMLSFGYTLLIGMILNVFIGVSISKKLLLSVISYPKWYHAKYFRNTKQPKVRGFYENKKFVAIISGAIVLIGIGGLFVKGVRLDTQFTGGAVLNYAIEGEIATDSMKAAIQEVTNRPVTVQISKNQMDDTKSITITLAGTGGMTPEKQKEVTTVVGKEAGRSKVTLTETYVVEPYIGAKALKNSELAIGLSIVFMVIYVGIRFAALNGLPAGITAIIALVHDVFVVFMTFVIFCIPLNDSFVAVVLTIVGYSINDTIVLYDRIRENIKSRLQLSIGEQVNLGISQTLTRSLNTSFTTGMCVLIILVASLIFGISSIKEFALPMFFGLISGCYSSICIASILWAIWEERKIKKAEVV